MPPKRVALAFSAIVFLASPYVLGQEKKRELQVKPQLTYSQLPEAVRQRYAHLFKPDFAKLDLAEDSLKEGKSQSKTNVVHLKSGSQISFRLVITNASEREVVGYSELDPHILNRPQLYRDGELVSYRVNVKELLQAKDKALSSGRSNAFALEPGNSTTEAINLDDWYEPLQAGRYDLSVWHRFAWGGEWVESPSVTFEVAPEILKCPN
jgi:hypothetical protein